jgi:hypothetical protein
MSGGKTVNLLYVQEERIMGLLDDILQAQSESTDKANKLKREQSKLEQMNPAQKRVLQEFFSPGFGIEQKTGCFGGGPDLKMMSASEYRAFVEQQVAPLNIKSKGLSKHGIDEDQVKEVPPVEFRGFSHTKDSFYKQGCSNLYEVTWLFFSSEQLYIYSILLDMLSDTKKERTEEYFYKDVTSFSSATDSVEKIELFTETKRRWMWLNT